MQPQRVRVSAPVCVWTVRAPRHEQGCDNKIELSEWKIEFSFVFPLGSWYGDDQHLLSRRERPPVFIGSELKLNQALIECNNHRITLACKKQRERGFIYTSVHPSVALVQLICVALSSAFTAVVKNKTKQNTKRVYIWENSQKLDLTVLKSMKSFFFFHFFTLPDEETFLRWALDYFQTRENTYH